MDTSMDIHEKSVAMHLNMDEKFHIHGKPASEAYTSNIAELEAAVGKPVQQCVEFVPSVRRCAQRHC